MIDCFGTHRVDPGLGELDLAGALYTLPGADTADDFTGCATHEGRAIRQFPANCQIRGITARFGGKGEGGHTAGGWGLIRP